MCPRCSDRQWKLKGNKTAITENVTFQTYTHTSICKNAVYLNFVTVGYLQA